MWRLLAVTIFCQIEGFVSTAPKLPADAQQTEAADYKSIALLSACHFSDDLNQGVVPAMLPFFITAYHLSYAAAA